MRHSIRGQFFHYNILHDVPWIIDGLHSHIINRKNNIEGNSPSCLNGEPLLTPYSSLLTPYLSRLSRLCGNSKWVLYPGFGIIIKYIEERSA